MVDDGNDGEAKGRAVGGRARAEKLSPERRSEIAALGGKARHGRPLPKASHAGTLSIGDLKIPCYVLENGTRILSQRGLNDAMGVTQGGGVPDGGLRTPRFIRLEALKPYISNDLTAALLEPIEFAPLHGGRSVLGFPATTLPDICTAWLKADEAKALKTERQLETARRAKILSQALLHVAIIALVDEATGYQEIRPKDALQAYLELVIRKELAAWVKKFPDEFYINIYKLKGWAWPGMSKNRFSVVGHYTNDLVFDRLASGLLAELKQRTPKDDKGRHKHRLHQWLTEEVGDPLLAQHMHSLIMFQRLAISNGYGWKRFVKMVDQVLPKRGMTMELPYLNADNS